MTAALVGVVGTRLMMQQGTENPSPTPTLSVSSVLDLTPYDRAAVLVSASHAIEKYSQGGEDRIDALLDNRAGIVWRYPGTRIGEMVNFTFQPDTEPVGVWIIDGDTIGQGCRVGHRTLAVRWTFSDSPWVVQPLNVGHPGDQEVRFPPVAIDDVLMTMLSTIEPRSPETIANTVAVSHVELLGRS